MRDPLVDAPSLIRRVYAYVAYRIGDGPDAEDVTSATFERALRYRSSFDPRRGEPAAWLIGIARREIETHRLARSAATSDEIELEDPFDLAGATAIRLDLHRAMAMLGERDRELLALRYGADLTARQIASLLNERVNSVEVALHRAIARLRVHIGPREGATDEPLAVDVPMTP